MADQHSKGVPVSRPRGPNIHSDSVTGNYLPQGPQDQKSRIQVCVETSQAEKHAGINVSYENSFNAIKKDIAKETVDKKIRHAVLTKEVIPIEEKPNKPKEKMIVKGGSVPQDHYGSQRSGQPSIIKHEYKNSTQPMQNLAGTMDYPLSTAGNDLSADFGNNTMNDSLLKSQLRSSVIVKDNKSGSGAFNHGITNSLLQTYAHPPSSSQ